MVLLHGWALHAGVFAPLVEALEDRFTLHLVDLPGHGRSRSSDIPLQADACARAIAAATPPAVWLGWSMGGLIALNAAYKLPEQVQALVMLCSSPCLVRKPDWKYAVSAEIFDQFRTINFNIVFLKNFGNRFHFFCHVRLNRIGSRFDML